MQDFERGEKGLLFLTLSYIMYGANWLPDGIWRIMLFILLGVFGVGNLVLSYREWSADRFAKQSGTSEEESAGDATESTSS